MKDAVAAVLNSASSASSLDSVTATPGRKLSRSRSRLTLGWRVRSPPQFERERHRIDVDRRPPRGFIAVSVNLAMVKPANRDRVLVGDLPSERARLGETNVMRFARNSAADNARLCRHISTVEFVAQSDGLRSKASVSCAAHWWQNNRRRIGLLERVVCDGLLYPEADRIFGRFYRSWLRLWSRLNCRRRARALPRSRLRRTR